MSKDNFYYSFEKSISNETAIICSNLMEAGIDTILEEGLLKEIPFLSNTISIYKIGKSIHERFLIRKLIAFIDEINKGLMDERERERYKKKFLEKEKFRNQELELILIIMEQYIESDKSRMLAKLYLAYLDEMINWNQFRIYTEIINRFLPTDYQFFQSNNYFDIKQNIDSDVILRLSGLGLLVEDTQYSSGWEDFSPNGMGITPTSMQRLQNRERRFLRTDFGELLVSLLSRNGSF